MLFCSSFKIPNIFITKVNEELFYFTSFYKNMYINPFPPHPFTFGLHIEESYV